MFYALVWSSVVIVGDIPPDSLPHFQAVLKRVKVDVLVFDGTPESLNPDIILTTTFPVHADSYVVLV